VAQDVEKKKAEQTTPHFFSLNQDIVAGSQKEKCALEYDILKKKAEPFLTLPLKSELSRRLLLLLGFLSLF
jgi:hypothetical protein